MRAQFVALVGALLLASTAAFAQTAADCPPPAHRPTNEQMRVGIRDARDHGFLWRISKDGRAAYLYGTLHVARPEWMYPGPAVTQALKASDTLALELDLFDPDIQRRVQQGTLRKADAPPLPDALQQRIDHQAAGECLPPGALATLSPELQMITLALLAGRRDGLDPSYGIDIVLSGWGHAQKMTVVSLETPKLQMTLLQAATPAARIESVQSALEQLESGRARAQMRRMAQMWADGDLDELASYEAWCECLKTEADRTMMRRLLDDRNPALADSIAALHASGKNVFAAVGSLHMSGATGLPELMAQRGYTVERIPPRR